MRCSERPTPTVLLRAIFVAPLARLKDAGLEGAVLGAVGAAVSWVLGSPLALLLVIYLALVLADHLLGAKIASAAGRYDATLARAGVLGKGTSLLLVLAVRGIEHAAHLGGLLDTRGSLALGLLVVLLLVELESVDRHRETLTGHPTPLLRPVLDFLRRAAEGVVPGGGR